MIVLDDGTCICGVVKVGERGQIVIPKETREHFGIKAGDSLFVTASKEKNKLIIFKAKDAKEFSEHIKEINEEA